MDSSDGGETHQLSHKDWDKDGPLKTRNQNKRRLEIQPTLVTLSPPTPPLSPPLSLRRHISSPHTPQRDSDPTHQGVQEGALR